MFSYRGEVASRFELGHAVPEVANPREYEFLQIMSVWFYLYLDWG